MKRIIEYRRLLDITPNADLVELKTTYRNLIKEWHPDKYIDEERKAEAEHKSKNIIEAYHFLVSIAPETQAFNLDNYTNTTNNSGIEDYSYKGQTLKITFQDGSVYEYFGIPKNIYNKFLNSSTLLRFARRHIFYSYTYRNVSKQTA
ncbi:MAG: KTSC domain-containing protein [Mariniphaga sp.]